jgi:type VI secretion system ImpH/TssG family protein
MGSGERLIRRIMRAAHSGGADFFETVRDFDQAACDLPRTGCADSAADEVLRFSQMPSLHAEKAVVKALSRESAEGGAVFAELCFFGLCGIDGPLPLELTSEVLQRSVNGGDPALQRFLDIINQRFISLLYRAYAQNSECFNFDRAADDLHRAALRALSGAGALKDLPLPSFGAEGLTQFTLTRNPGARGLEAALCEFLGHECQIRCNVFSSGLIPPELRCRLGREDSAVLGVNTQIGRFFYSSTKKFELRMGPMDYEECLKLLPGSALHTHLIALVSFCLPKPLDCDLVFILRKDSLKSAQLNGKFSLGRSIFFPYRDQGGTCTLTINASRLSGRERRATRSHDA